MASPLAESGLFPLADLPYPEQLERRRALVVEAFRKGRVAATVADIVPSPRSEGYRARIKLHGDGSRLGFRREGSHALVELPLERIALPPLVAAAAELGGFRGEIELRSDGSAVRADRRFRGLETGPLRIDGLRVSVRSFFQVNLEVNRLVVAAVDALLVRLAPVALLDLFGGVGNLSVAAARRGTPVVLVEREGNAASDARHNLAGSEARVVAGDALRLRAGEHFFDVALLDPPRAGAPGLLPTLAVTRPRAVIYLSCDPATLARDVATLLPLGYRLTELRPFDMFPGTLHVETLALLERG